MNTGNPDKPVSERPRSRWRSGLGQLTLHMEKLLAWMYLRSAILLWYASALLVLSLLQAFVPETGDVLLIEGVTEPKTNDVPLVGGVLGWGILIVLVISLITRDTGRKGGTDGEPDDPADIEERRARQRATYDKIAMFRVGYGFAVLVTLAAIYVLVSTPDKAYVSHQSVVEYDGHRYWRSLISVIPGCDFAERPAENDEEESTRLASMPNAARYCGNLPPQWVLNIGGLILPCHVNGTCRTLADRRALARQSERTGTVKQGGAASIAGCPADSTAGCGKAVTCSGPAQPNCMSGSSVRPSTGPPGACVAGSADRECPVTRQQLESRIKQLQRDRLTAAAEVREATRVARIAGLQRASGLSLVEYGQKVDAAQGRLRAAAGDLDSLDARLATARSDLRRYNRDRHIDNDLSAAKPVVGGVIVPIYFLALAVVGALVAMYRKLPEFQARNDPAYDAGIENSVMSGEKPRPPVPDSQVAELVVFQMLQVITAAPIAVLAYAWANPQNLSTSIILAFVAGFSSETILVAARGLVDKLVGAAPRGLRYEKIRAKILGSSQSRSAVTLGNTIMHIGDEVRLRQDVDEFIRGTRGKILGIGPADLTVRLTQGDQVRTVTRSDNYFEAWSDIEEPPASLSDPVG